MKISFLLLAVSLQCVFSFPLRATERESGQLAPELSLLEQCLKNGPTVFLETTGLPSSNRKNGDPCTADYQCQSGHCVCQSHGGQECAPKITQCAPSSEAPANGHPHACSDTLGEVGRTCEMTCNEDFILSAGSLTRTCQENGMWSTITAVCSALAPAIKCNPSGTAPLNGNAHSCSDTLGTMGQTCDVACNEDFLLSAGSFTRTCQEDGEWSPITAVCSPALSFKFQSWYSEFEVNSETTVEEMLAQIEPSGEGFCTRELDSAAAWGMELTCESSVTENIGYSFTWSWVQECALPGEFRVGVDMGRGWAVLLNGHLVDSITTAFYEGNYFNGNWENENGGVQHISLRTFQSGLHVVQVIGFEGCCEDTNSVQYRVPGGEWKDLDSTFSLGACSAEA